MSNPRHRIQVDHSERAAPLLELLRQSDDFEVRLARLTVGDYLIDDEVLIERKTIADFAASLGPALASRLLRQFGSIRSVVTADIDTLQQVRGVGPKRATRIVELLG